MRIEDGILMAGRFSIGWNFHPSRTVKTFGLGFSYTEDRWMVLFGPLMFIYLF